MQSSGAEGYVAAPRRWRHGPVAAVLEIQVLQAPHIAEADDAAMTRMEGQMTASEAAARKALDS